jgi:hypothetical protein
MMANDTLSLVAHTVQLLRERPRSLTLDDIAATTGLSKSWLNLLLSGDYKDPGTTKVQKLYEHLAGKPLLNVDN